MTTLLNQDRHPELTGDHTVFDLCLFITPFIGKHVDGDGESQHALAAYGRYAAGFLAALEQFIAGPPAPGLVPYPNPDVDVSDDVYQVTVCATLAVHHGSDLGVIYSNYLREIAATEDDYVKKVRHGQLENEIGSHIQGLARTSGCNFQVAAQFRGELHEAA